tara:strand:- start:167 stop:373 length:207 start_codon:yes stop_codon:yes gene_type:complete
MLLPETPRKDTGEAAVIGIAADAVALFEAESGVEVDVVELIAEGTVAARKSMKVNNVKTLFLPGIRLR